jgi:hypothetical protein
MDTAGIRLAAGAIAAALLLTGFSGAVAVADPPDSTGSESANNTASDTSHDPPVHSAEENTFSGNASVADQADKGAESRDSEVNDAAREQTAGEHSDVNKPDNHDHDHHADCPGDKTINKVPLRPEAPVNLAPEAPILEAPMPAIVPPVIPASPVDPDTVDSATGGDGHRPGGNEPRVVTAPVLIAPAPLPSVHLGASVAPSWTSTGGRPVDPAPPAREPSPRLLRASVDGPALRESTLTSFGVTSPGQLPYRNGSGEYTSRPLASVAAGALPGVAGLVLMTAVGICLGYRQAKTSQELQTGRLDRFAN